MYRNRLEEDVLKWYYKRPINEASSDSAGRGSYLAPLRVGKKIFDKSQIAPFTEPVSKYTSQLLAVDSYDGKMDLPKKTIQKIEKKAKQSSLYAKKHPVQNDDDGDNLNQFPGKKLTIVPIKEWVEITENTVMEDLGVWFGTKKKPKGSKQPKGPWVNICRKVDGKHPPCGRPEASDKGYPKCRAAGVAGKMTDAQKKSACQQKRRAEKTHSKSGTGNKPKMVSYKKKKNEGLEMIIKNVLRETITDRQVGK